MNAQSRTAGGSWASAAGRGRFVAALGLMGAVASGCAGAMGPELPAAAPAAPAVASEVYRAEVLALAREARALVMADEEEGAGAGSSAERCDLDAGYSGALYDPTEPLSSMVTLVSAEELCDKAHIQCFDDCWKVAPPKEWGKKRGDGHYRYCTSKCLNEYMACLKAAGVHQFGAMSDAVEWLKGHPVVAGAMVIVGAAVYVVATGGGGALTLVLL